MRDRDSLNSDGDKMLLLALDYNVNVYSPLPPT